ncbi:Phloem protein 2-like [Macleaya cordata]|uniref:Phloem protein 2-like n=1 Tax=Macleaya cordata TaxID=56857 RepID=A0A200Q5A0_MACCD|nr:Phloem protein 2-like [Macleaya cordata]
MEKHEKETEDHEEKGSSCVKADFNILPEGCISSILSLTSPRDACRSSLVSSVFKSAAESDALWDKFLPSDYKEIISRSFSPSSSATTSVVNFSSKKELYYRLCEDPLLIDGGHKCFALEKWSGKKCFMLGAKDLSIIWGNTPKYWRWRAFPGSRFAEVAELLSVCWLEIHGKLETRLLSPKTLYAAYLVLKFVEGAFGFDHPPAEAVVKVVGGGPGSSGCTVERPIYLDPDGSRRRQLQVAPHRIGLIRRRFGHILRPAASMSRWEGQFPQERGDGWMEIEMGHFYNGGEEDGGGEVQMTLTEVKGGHWKAGLIIQGIELRPKENK